VGRRTGCNAEQWMLDEERRGSKRKMTTRPTAMDCPGANALEEHVVSRVQQLSTLRKPFPNRYGDTMMMSRSVHYSIFAPAAK
jgi:hypothetical protein